MNKMKAAQTRGAAEVEFCVNLCDLLLGATSPDVLEVLLERVRVQAEAARVDRVYVGSYLCPAYFAAVCGDPIDVVLRWCVRHGAATTLVVPVASEGEFAQVVACVDGVLGRTFGVGAGFVDEVCVNDLGMARHAAHAWCAGGGIRLVLGRLFDKAPRDPRYRDAFAGERVVEVSELAGCPGLGDAAQLVSAVEVEPTNDLLVVAGGEAAVAVHEPFACLTLGRVCEFAAVGSPMERMFRPGAPCSRACVDARVRYALRDGVELLRVGKGVYARHACEVREARAGGLVRRVYWPVEEVEVGRGGLSWLK